MGSLKVLAGHPIVDDRIARMRDVSTGREEFRRLGRELSGFVAFEALRDLPNRIVPVTTPLVQTEGHRLTEPLVVVGVLRAALMMIESVVSILPECSVGHIGLARDEKSLEPVEYLVRLPADIAKRPVLLVDPMLATGGSACYAIGVLKAHGVKDLRLACLFGAPEGVDAVKDKHPDVPVTLAVLDDFLNEHGYIVPGLGDAGDRAFGT